MQILSNTLEQLLFEYWTILYFIFFRMRQHPSHRVIAQLLNMAECLNMDKLTEHRQLIFINRVSRTKKLCNIHEWGSTLHQHVATNCQCHCTMSISENQSQVFIICIWTSLTYHTNRSIVTEAGALYQSGQCAQPSHRQGRSFLIIIKRITSMVPIANNLKDWLL